MKVGTEPVIDLDAERSAWSPMRASGCGCMANMIRSATARSAPSSAIAKLGFLLHLAMGVLILVSGLIMPVWAVVVLGVVWLVALVFVFQARDRPFIVLVVPVAMLGIWLATAWLGETLLDWTA